MTATTVVMRTATSTTRPTALDLLAGTPRSSGVSAGLAVKADFQPGTGNCVSAAISLP
ncbi:hypothetical protein HG619_24535 [Pseudomonas syringae]|nr:hypothetical protein [Pseudomonas syringae]